MTPDPRTIAQAKAEAAWAIKHFGPKMTPDELADAIFSSPAMQDLLRPAVTGSGPGNAPR